MTACCDTQDSICPCGGFTHPEVIFNPAGSATLAYRVGDYAAFRRALLQSLPGETELSSTDGSVTTQIWRPTGQGDLALQMMEWWAYLADILTFYNQRIANQAYLGTADLPESVYGLVKLLGYRPRPGLGASGTLAALANTPLPFVLPQGFAIQSKPGPGQQPQTFELTADTTVGVQPTGPVSPAQMLGVADAVTTTLNQSSQSVSIPQSPITVAGSSSAVKKGDQVLVLPKAFTPTDTAFGLAAVTAVTPATDPTLGKITNISVAWNPDANGDPGAWQLYRGGQSTQFWQYNAGTGVVTDGTTIHLQTVVRGIQNGDPIVLQYGSPPSYQLLVANNTTETVWYANSPSLTDPSTPQPSSSNIPSISIVHTVLTVTPASNTSVFGSSGDTMDNRPNNLLWHSWTEVADLISVPDAAVPAAIDSGQNVTLQLPAQVTLPAPTGLNGTIPVLVVDSVGTGATGTASATPGSADSAANVVLELSAPLLIPPLKTYLNLLQVTRGKTVPDEVLGNGDATLAGQDFMLQKSPVTYLPDPASVSGNGYSSTVQVRVNGLLWTEVQSFYRQPADGQIYITREDVTGNTHVVFGDGINGSRLPTGVSNVVATYRYGSGATSPAAGTLTNVLKPQPGLRSVANPVAVGGGSDPDSPAKIRQLAPQSVLTFGRAVSADDFRVIAAQASGVTRAAAVYGFDAMQQRPGVTVWVGDDDDAVTSARAAIAGAADPNRLPSVLPATSVTVRLSLAITVDPRYQFLTVQANVRAALIDPDTGLFGVNVVGIGEAFFDSQIYAACLAVPGVSAVDNLDFFVRPRFTDDYRRFDHRGKTAKRTPSVAACGANRHDPGAGNYYFIADDGFSLVINPGVS